MPRRLFTTAIAAVVAVLTWIPAPGANAGGLDVRARAGQLDGIDVSKWQEVIDWRKVATTSTRFAIIRATRDHDYVDPTYATNAAGASGAGLVVGAYHYSSPSATPGDARREADLFLATARNRAGDLLPVLDLEDSGGLAPEDLQRWVRGWVVRVGEVLGVRPMIYTSPNFWSGRMRDTTWFADNGYPLWIAHWGVTTPEVPADGWGGKGWLFHQWTSHGHVNGIRGRVDLDRSVGSSLGSSRIASIALTPAAGGLVSGPGLSCGGSSVRCERLANPGDELTLTATPDADAVLLGWTEACAEVGSSPTCTVTARGTVRAAAVFGYAVDVALTGSGGGSVTSKPAGVDCPVVTCVAAFPAGSAVTLTAAPDPASDFVEWSGACSGTTPTCKVTVAGPTAVGARFDAATQLDQLDQDGPGTSYRWSSSRDARATGGSYLTERAEGATATFSFSGGAVTLYMVHGPEMGRARVLIDGVAVGGIDGYGRVLESRPHRFEGLGPGAHTLQVLVTGVQRPASSGSWVGVDALRWAGALRGSPVPDAAMWATSAHHAAFGGDVAISDVAGAEARLAFRGTKVTLLTARGPAIGVAELWVDGALRRTWDLSSDAKTFGVRRTVTGLSNAKHVVRLVVTGRRGAHGNGTAVIVDGWIVR